jgi:MFS family permease
MVAGRALKGYEDSKSRPRRLSIPACPNAHLSRAFRPAELRFRPARIGFTESNMMAIACFYALGTAIGGSTSPLLFGWLIESGSAWRVSADYLAAAALLLIAAGTELVLGIDAEGKSLESIADPLSS